MDLSEVDFQGSPDAIHPALHIFSPGAVSIESLSTFDAYAANPRFQELQTELRSYLFTGANSAAPTRGPTPEENSTASRQNLGHRQLLEHLTNAQTQIPLLEKLKYLQVWKTKCAPWLDMFDQQRHFGLQVPLLGQTSRAVLYAMLALSARQTERQRGIKASHHSLELYQESITSLTPLLNAKEPVVLVTACILCVLEMMSVSPRDWRRHVEGCAALFQASGVGAFSGGLLQAVFWCYARMDLCGAIIADGAESTVLPIDKWVILDDPSPGVTSSLDKDRLVSQTFLERGRQIPDMHANYAVYLCARVCDILAARTRHVELGEENGFDEVTFHTTWTLLWEELQEWWRERPVEILPVKTTHPTSGEHQHQVSFPAILFAHWAAISSNQLYHTACIMMLEMRPTEDNSSHSTINQSIYSALWHARRVVGISLTNPHQGCLNNAIQPLYVAGKLCSHRDEHQTIVRLLNQIEALTGWGSRWRIKDLEIAWGYPLGTFSGDSSHQRTLRSYR